MAQPGSRERGGNVAAFECSVMSGAAEPDLSGSACRPERGRRRSRSAMACAIDAPPLVGRGVELALQIGAGLQGLGGLHRFWGATCTCDRSARPRELPCAPECATRIMSPSPASPCTIKPRAPASGRNHGRFAVELNGQAQGSAASRDRPGRSRRDPGPSPRGPSPKAGRHRPRRHRRRRR